MFRSVTIQYDTKRSDVCYVVRHPPFLCVCTSTSNVPLLLLLMNLQLIRRQSLVTEYCRNVLPMFESKRPICIILYRQSRRLDQSSCFSMTYWCDSMVFLLYGINNELDGLLVAQSTAPDKIPHISNQIISSSTFFECTSLLPRPHF